MTPPNAASPGSKLRRIMGGYFGASAGFGWAATLSQIGAGVIGVVLVPRVAVGSYAPVWLTGAAYLAFLFRLASDRLGRRGEAAHRAFEWIESLGIAPSARELADIEDDVPWYVMAMANRIDVAEPYYASTLAESPGRAVTNTYESAWWTARLAIDMVRVETLKFGAFALGGLLVLRAAGVAAGRPGGAAKSTIELGSAMILFLITQGPLRRIIDFVALRDGAAKTVARCESALVQPIDRAEAVRTLTSYQLVRAAAPRLPTLLWKLRRRRLNELWGAVARSFEAPVDV